MSITKKTLQEIVKSSARASATIDVAVGDETVQIEVRPVITFAQYSQAAKDIADIQFVTDDDGNAMYAPYLAEFARRFVLMSYFTNLDLKALEKKSKSGTTIGSVEPIWTVLMSWIYDDVLEYVDPACWDGICAAAKDLVDAKRRMTEPGPQRVWNQLDGFVAQMKQSFGDMTPEDLEETRAAVKKLTELDEGEIVKLMR